MIEKCTPLANTPPSPRHQQLTTWGFGGEMADGQFLASWFGLGVLLFVLGVVLCDKNRELAQTLGAVGGFIIAMGPLFLMFFPM